MRGGLAPEEIQAPPVPTFVTFFKSLSNSALEILTSAHSTSLQQGLAAITFFAIAARETGGILFWLDLPREHEDQPDWLYENTTHSGLT
jgi:hypothetical protein